MPLLQIERQTDKLNRSLAEEGMITINKRVIILMFFVDLGVIFDKSVGLLDSL